MDAVIERELLAFVAHEARLLDAGRLDEWLAALRRGRPLLGAAAGRAQADDGAHNSLADEDRLLLALRIERLKNPRAHSQRPPSRCQHVLQQPAVVHADDGAARYELHTPFVYIESRGERQIVLAGNARHSLVRGAAGTRIRLKRVDLLDAGAALPAIQLFP